MINHWNFIIIKSFLFLLSPFPKVAEAIQEDIERYRQSEDEVKRLKSQMVCLRKNFLLNKTKQKEFHLYNFHRVLKVMLKI